MAPPAQALMKERNIVELGAAQGDPGQAGGRSMATAGLATKLVQLCCAQGGAGPGLHSLPDPQIQHLNSLISSGQQEAALGLYMQVCMATMHGSHVLACVRERQP